MDLKFDKRSVLLPAADLVTAITNNAQHRYSTTVRQQMVTCVFQDILEGQGTRAAFRAYGEAAGKLGRQFRRWMEHSEGMRGAPRELTLYNEGLLQQRIVQRLAEYNLYEACVASEDGKVGQPIEPGFTVDWFLGKGKQQKLAHRHVVIEWTRPRLDHRSVSVQTFVETITDALVKRKHPREQVERIINAIPLRDLLNPSRGWDGLLQHVTSRLKGGLK